MMIEPVAGNPFQEGGDAYAAGARRDSCPYADESDPRREWLDGWDEAKRSLTEPDRSR